MSNVIKHPNTILRERVSFLEKKVAEKEVDILVLKDICCRMLKIVLKYEYDPRIEALLKKYNRL